MVRRGSRGSNQYRTRGSGPSGPARRSLEDVAAAVEDELQVEQAAVAFGQPVPQLENARSAAALKRLVAAGGPREAIAARKNCPSDLLTFLAFDESAQVRGAVAVHPRCPPEVLAMLARSRDGNIPFAAAANPNCPPEAVD